MAQTNVMVTYAPARQPAASAAMRQDASPGTRRWSAGLAGALLAGGAVFTLGQFVTPDGSHREADFPMRPGTPISGAQRVTVVPAARPSPIERQDAAETEPLPYLAVVRDIAPRAPSPPAARAMSAPTVRAQPLVPRDSPAPKPPIADGSTLLADAATPPMMPPAGGLRRDLEGFLQTQGHELVSPEAPGALAATEGVLPPAPALQLAEAAELPSVESGPVERSGTSPDTPTAALAGTVEPSPPTPRAVTPTQRLADVAPAASAAPVASAEPVMPEEPPARFAVATPPALGDLSASSVEAAVQSYPLAVVNGEPLGAVTLRDGGANAPAIHLGALLELVRLRMPEAEFIRLSGAAAADRFVTLDELRAAGITVTFDPREKRLLIEAR